MPATSHPSDADDYFEALPAYDWRPVPTGAGLAYVTEPLDSDTVVLGSGSVDVWLRSSARDVDLEVTISEIRPDGQEMYVQSGWLRASHRALDDEASTRLEPVHSHTRADTAPLPRERFTLVRVPVFPFGHAFRTGSRIRLTIQAPGGNRPRWEFATVEADGEVVNSIVHSATRPSRVVLPVVDGIDVTSPLPACPSLRGQPCRAHAIPQEDA
jgi:predicted acyl esterase